MSRKSSPASSSAKAPADQPRPEPAGRYGVNAKTRRVRVDAEGEYAEGQRGAEVAEGGLGVKKEGVVPLVSLLTSAVASAKTLTSGLVSGTNETNAPSCAPPLVPDA